MKTPDCIIEYLEANISSIEEDGVEICNIFDIIIEVREIRFAVDHSFEKLLNKTPLAERWSEDVQRLVGMLQYYGVKNKSMSKIEKLEKRIKAKKDRMRIDKKVITKLLARF